MASGEESDWSWRDVPRWTKALRRWWREQEDDIGWPSLPGLPPHLSLEQSHEWLRSARNAYRAERGMQMEWWYEFGGDLTSEDVLSEWVTHLECPSCGCLDVNLGDAWGTVECLDCEGVWQPEWVTPWGPPAPPTGAKFTTGECPMCGKTNRRYKPDGPRAFLCHLPRDLAGTGGGAVIAIFAVPDRDWRVESRPLIQPEYDTSGIAYATSCLGRFNAAFAAGWFRSNPVYFNFCQGCGALFAARLAEQTACSPECGPLPDDYARRLRTLAQRASPAVRREDIFDRDSWTCYLCGEKTDPKASDPLRRPSIDHVVPIAKGGRHTVDNLRTTHLGCNIAKGDRQTEPIR